MYVNGEMDGLTHMREFSLASRRPRARRSVPTLVLMVMGMGRLMSTSESRAKEENSCPAIALQIVSSFREDAFRNLSTFTPCICWTPLQVSQ
jgi:hypothetical protein